MTRRFVCKADEVRDDALKELVTESGERVCLVKSGGTLYACQAACPHEGMPLCDGCIDGTTLTCLEHLWQWNLATGEALGLAEKALTVFAVEVEDGSVYLQG